MKGIIRSNALAWADKVVEGCFFLLQNYLTDVWKLSFYEAAAFLNIWGGLYRILPIFLVFLSRRKRSSSFVSFIMHAVSGIFSSTGLVVITYTALRGYQCHHKGEEECVGRTEKAVFITGMALIGVGRATRIAFPLTDVDEDQSSEHSGKPSCWSQVKDICGILRFLLLILFFVTPVVAFFAFPYVKKWYILFGVAAMCTVLATLAHLSRFRTYKQAISSRASTRDSPLPAVGRASPLDVVMLYSTLIMCGVVSSIGNTYFVQQATQMNYNIGHWKPPLQVLQLIFIAFKLYFALGISAQLLYRNDIAEFGSYLATMYSAICCAVAAAVERRRVHAVRRHHLVDQPDNVKTPMSAFWLLFQVSFLGIVESSLGYGLSKFIKEEAPESIKRYGDYLSEAVTGLGYMCSVLSVYVVGKMSQTGGGKGWFQHTLNASRLDRYYWVLSALSAVYFLVHVMAMYRKG